MRRCPSPMRPTSSERMSRNSQALFCHWYRSSLVCTITRAGCFLSPIADRAMTVLPAPGGASRTPNLREAMSLSAAAW
ncbi:MAG: hypothetical protein BWX71_02822 [Deltaproteobacteria bacterium ADurb.Bin072]|nr:MAG: hypothetical protein BWX71_02822 [Deltaproteobacteria bacterium ADurb.Bin072]